MKYQEPTKRATKRLVRLQAVDRALAAARAAESVAAELRKKVTDQDRMLALKQSELVRLRADLVELGEILCANQGEPVTAAATRLVDEAHELDRMRSEAIDANAALVERGIELNALLAERTRERDECVAEVERRDDMIEELRTNLQECLVAEVAP